MTTPDQIREEQRAHIRRCLEKTGMNPTALARAAGLAPSTIVRFLNQDVGHVLGAQTLAKIDAACARAPAERGGFVAQPIEVPQPGELPRNLPVLGCVVGGEDGAFEMNGEVHDYVERPPSLMAAKNAYAVYMTGESMEPVLREGYLLQVNPTRPPTPRAHVVIQLRPAQEHGKPLCFVKEFVRRTATKLVCRQYNPAQELEWPLDQVIAVHRVVGIADM